MLYVIDYITKYNIHYSNLLASMYLTFETFQFCIAAVICESKVFQIGHTSNWRLAVWVIVEEGPGMLAAMFRRIPNSRFFLWGPNFSKLRLTLQKFSAEREKFLYFQVNIALQFFGKVLSRKLCNCRNFCSRLFFSVTKTWTRNNNLLYSSCLYYYTNYHTLIQSHAQVKSMRVNSECWGSYRVCSCANFN